MGLEVAGAILELGGDVVCVDRAPKPLEDLWGKNNSAVSSRFMSEESAVVRCLQLPQGKYSPRRRNTIQKYGTTLAT